MTYTPISELTLLDWYAAQAMQGLTAHHGYGKDVEQAVGAARAFDISEKMLLDREKRMAK